MKRAALLGVAVIIYLSVAWAMAPGFYDAFTPQQPYNWVCPPFHTAGNLSPSSGYLDVKVIGGVSDANAAYTEDGQVVIGFLPGAFDVTGKKSIAVDIKPVDPCPQHPALTFVTNAYLITADAPLVKPANLVLRFSDVVPAPSTVYYAASTDGPWASIGAGAEAQPFTINTKTSKFGYFAAGYPAGSVSKGGIRSQILPIAVALLIIGVLVAGIPLAIIRRRQGTSPEAEATDEPEA